MNSSGYEYQQEQQHGYDPSQTQTPSYDQSSQPYYPYNYAQDNQPQPQFQQDPNSTPIAPEQSHSAEPSQAHAPDPLQAATVPGSINPAAVAVVAGALAQLVGNLDGVPRELVKLNEINFVVYFAHSHFPFSHSQNYLVNSYNVKEPHCILNFCVTMSGMP